MQSKISIIVPHSSAHMANRAGNPIKTVSEPGVVADFNVRNHPNYLELDES
jgi:hypothetical protein